MNIDLTPIFQAIIALLAALITYKLIPWIRSKTTAEQQTFLAATVRTLVFAADQIYGAGRGDEKLEYVIRQLESRGFTADRNEIEAAVKMMNDSTAIAWQELSEVREYVPPEDGEE